MQEPPPRYNPPPGEPPTEPTRRVVDPYAPAAVEQEYALDPVLAEKIDRASFWSRFGSAAAVAAAILGIIALFVALDARDKANNDGGGSNAGLRSDVNQLQSDVNRLDRQVSSGNQSQSSDVESQVSDIQDQLKQISDDQQQQAQDISTLKTDLSQLSDRVDQVEKAQEQAASGGP
jgi:septal ring factor EnvC (AmiA/AmiB activator)